MALLLQAMQKPSKMPSMASVPKRQALEMREDSELPRKLELILKSGYDLCGVV